MVLDFVSPENVTECIQLIEELRLLPENHKAKVDSIEVNYTSMLLASSVHAYPFVDCLYLCFKKPGEENGIVQY